MFSTAEQAVNKMNAKGVTDLWQEIPRRVIWRENHNSASYAEQSVRHRPENKRA